MTAIKRCVAPNITPNCCVCSALFGQSAAMRLLGSSAEGTGMGTGSCPLEMLRHPRRWRTAQEQGQREENHPPLPSITSEGYGGAMAAKGGGEVVNHDRITSQSLVPPQVRGRGVGSWLHGGPGGKGPSGVR